MGWMAGCPGYADGWGWIGGGLMMLLWAALVAAVVWFAVTRAPAGTVKPSVHARTILAERFARGEISADEYDEMLRRLR